MGTDGHFWEREAWWAPQGNRAISFVKLTARWVLDADLTGFDKSRFRKEMQSWSTLVAAAPWVAAQYGDTPAMLASTNLHAVIPEIDAWNAVSDVLGRFADPLTRYTLSFYVEVHKRRPVVSEQHRDKVRECARSIAKDIRDSLIDTGRPGGSLLVSRESVLEFLDDAPTRRDQDRVLAMLSYAKRLIEYARDTSDDDELSSAVDTAVQALDAEFGTGSPDVVRQLIHESLVPHREAAKPKVLMAIMSSPQVRSQQYADEQIRRAIETVARKLRDGEPVPNARSILTILERKATDLEIEERRRLARQPRFSEYEEDKHQRAHEGWRRGYEHVEQKSVLAPAREYLRKLTIDSPRSWDEEIETLDAFWEKSLAIEILNDQTEVGYGVTVPALVRTRWRITPHVPQSVSRGAAQAATFVHGLLMLAVARALVVVYDFTDWIGREDPTVTWFERIQTVDAVLKAHRKNTAQRLFDTVRQEELQQDGDLI